MYPLLFGGGQEQGLRSGTENVPGIVGFGLACDMWAQFGREARRKLYELRQRLVSGILEAVPDAVLNSPEPDKAAPHIVNFSFPDFGVRPLSMLWNSATCSCLQVLRVLPGRANQAR